MKQLLLILIFCFCSVCPTVLPFTANNATASIQSANFDVGSFETTTQNYVVTANKANIFKEASFSSEILKTLNHKTIIKVELTDGNPTETLKDNFVFFTVTFEETTGFMFADLLVPEQKFLTNIPSFNAQTNTEATVYFLQDNQIKESGLKLKNKERIFLYEGFDSKKEYTAITFVLNNQDGTHSVMYGYLKSKDINPDGINPLLITCIVLILALLGIIFAWMFMKNKKIKFKKHKQTQKDTLN